MFVPVSFCAVKLVLSTTLSSLSRINVALTSLLSGPEKKFCILDLILVRAVLGSLILQFKSSTTVMYTVPGYAASSACFVASTLSFTLRPSSVSAISCQLLAVNTSCVIPLTTVPADTTVCAVVHLYTLSSPPVEAVLIIKSPT